MLARLYNWTLAKAAHPRALWILAGLSFAESSFFPLPPDLLLIPMILAARRWAWRIALICSLASVFGGILGYYIGYGLFDAVGQPIIGFYHMEDQFRRFTQLYNEYGEWIVGIAAFTPIPYKVFTIASGVAHLPLSTFIMASALSRSARFFLVAALLWKFGDPIRDFIEKRLGLLTLVFVILLLGSFFALKYI